MKNLLAEILITLIGKYAFCKINLASSDWIRDWPKCRDKNPPPSIDEFVKFVQRKVEDYKLSDNDKRIIESILIYKYE